jgi:hypothetical protein
MTVAANNAGRGRWPALAEYIIFGSCRISPCRLGSDRPGLSVVLRARGPAHAVSNLLVLPSWVAKW